MGEWQSTLKIITYLKDGDIISVDVSESRLDVRNVDIEERKNKGEREKKTVKRTVKGYLYQYQKNVKSAFKGVIIPSSE